MGSKKQTVIDKVFGGHNDPFTRIIVLTGSTTDPDTGTVTAPIGTFYVMDYKDNNVDKDIWINTGSTDRTSWTQLHDETP